MCIGPRTSGRDERLAIAADVHDAIRVVDVDDVQHAGAVICDRDCMSFRPPELMTGCGQQQRCSEDNEKSNASHGWQLYWRARVRPVMTW